MRTASLIVAASWALSACAPAPPPNTLTLRNTGARGSVVFTMGGVRVTLAPGASAAGLVFEPGTEVAVTSPDAGGESRATLSSGRHELSSSAEHGSVSIVDVALGPK